MRQRKGVGRAWGIALGVGSLVAVVFLIDGGGPVLGPGLTLYPLLGATFLLFAFVLAARVLALALGGPAGIGDRHSGPGAPPARRRRL